MRPEPDFIDEFILRRRAAPSLIRELVIGYPLSAMIKGSEIRKADHPIEKLVARSLVAACDVGRRTFRRGIDAALRSGALGAVFIQYSAMARSLCAPRHRTLADVLRFACGREQGLGKERSRSCRLQYYTEITRNMVGRVLTNRQVVRRYDHFAPGGRSLLAIVRCSSSPLTRTTWKLLASPAQLPLSLSSTQ